MCVLADVHSASSQGPALLYRPGVHLKCEKWPEASPAALAGKHGRRGGRERGGKKMRWERRMDKRFWADEDWIGRSRPLVVLAEWVEAVGGWVSEAGVLIGSRMGGCCGWCCGLVGACQRFHGPHWLSAGWWACHCWLYYFFYYYSSRQFFFPRRTKGGPHGWRRPRRSPTKNISPYLLNAV